MLKQLLKRVNWERLMLGRLLKYDFLYFFRFIPVFYLVILGLGAAGRLYRSYWGGIYSDDEMFIFILALFWFMVMVVMIITLVMVFQRFRDNLLKDPAYLMLTLPVSPWTLVASKVISAAAMFLLSGAVCAAAMLLCFKTIGFSGDVINAWQLRESLDRLMEMYFLQGGTAGTLALMAFSVILGSLENICLFFACLVAAQMAPRFRTLAVIALYFLVTALLRGPVMAVIAPACSPFLFSAMAAISSGSDIFRGFLNQLPRAAAVSLLFTLFYFWAGGALLKHTLNVE